MELHFTKHAYYGQVCVLFICAPWGSGRPCSLPSRVSSPFRWAIGHRRSWRSAAPIRRNPDGRHWRCRRYRPLLLCPHHLEKQQGIHKDDITTTGMAFNSRHLFLYIYQTNRACHPGGHYWNCYTGSHSFSHCNSLQDLVPIDESFKRLAVTGQRLEVTRMVVLTMATRWHDQLIFCCKPDINVLYLSL